jgi:prevent-host-death family protein
MMSVGIKELKAKLSSYVDLVQKGDEIVVTEHGKEVAMVIPFSPERRLVSKLMKSGKASWSGGKPEGLTDIRARGGSISNTVLEERR